APIDGPPEARLLRTGTVILNLTVGYDWILGDKVTIRAGAENALPIYRAPVHRDIGDRVELEAGARYIVWSPFSVAGLYRYAFKSFSECRVCDETGEETRRTSLAPRPASRACEQERCYSAPRRGRLLSSLPTRLTSVTDHRR